MCSAINIEFSKLYFTQPRVVPEMVLSLWSLYPIPKGKTSISKACSETFDRWIQSHRLVLSQKSLKEAKVHIRQGGRSSVTLSGTNSRIFPAPAIRIR
jgi:hypothetical protein